MFPRPPGRIPAFDGPESDQEVCVAKDELADIRKAFGEISRLSGGKSIELTKLDELYDVLGVVLARGMGDSAFANYLKRYQARLGSDAAAAARLLGPGRGSGR